MEIYERFAQVPVSRAHFERFKQGQLWQDWAKRYPELFDEDDLRVARTQAKMGYHFHEWLAALLIYEATGYLSLIESYEFKNQSRKQKILNGLLPVDVINAIEGITRSGKAQCPDLLCFSPDYSDWFFCEVKGPSDKSRPSQETQFKDLVYASNKIVKLFEFFYI